MSGSVGDGNGVVYLAHAWCPEEFGSEVQHPLHWWNVYKAEHVASMQALAYCRLWREHGKWEVLRIDTECPLALCGNRCSCNGSNASHPRNIKRVAGS